MKVSMYIIQMFQVPKKVTLSKKCPKKTTKMPLSKPILTAPAVLPPMEVNEYFLNFLKLILNYFFILKSG